MLPFRYDSDILICGYLCRLNVQRSDSLNVMFTLDRGVACYSIWGLSKNVIKIYFCKLRGTELPVEVNFAKF